MLQYARSGPVCDGLHFGAEGSSPAASQANTCVWLAVG
jgi:hypothetical protein